MPPLNVGHKRHCRLEYTVFPPGSPGGPIIFTTAPNTYYIWEPSWGLVNNTRIAGPHQAQYVGTLPEFARTVSYSHRIRALARTAALKETKTVVPREASVGSTRCNPELRRSNALLPPPVLDEY